MGKRSFFMCLLLLTLGFAMTGQNRLVPTTSISRLPMEGDATAKYNWILLKFLMQDEIGDYKYPNFIYMTIPAFSSEYVLIGSRDENMLVYTRAKENLYYKYYDKLDKRGKIKYSSELTETYKLQVPDSVMGILAELINSAVMTSSYLFKEYFLDGVEYHFEIRGNAAECCCPDGRCKELVTIFDKICSAVYNQNLDSINSLMPLCRKMTESFRRDYPVDWNGLSQSEKNTYDSQTEESCDVALMSYSMSAWPWKS